MITDNFSEDTDGKYKPLFKQSEVPVFQNKVYLTREGAVKAETGSVNLVQSLTSGFVFNRDFVPHLMNYDMHYQNEQSNSSVFKEHLLHVLNLLESYGIQDKKVVEVGCGKGVFFDMMLDRGIDCWGFDPTYEGNNSRIQKTYFDESQEGIDADVIIMRHTLEHITRPFSFLHTIAKVNRYKGLLFVEVPTLDWILQKKAFWDIFYEHCNYFTEESLAAMFDDAVTGNFFGGQYIYLLADLGKIRNTIPAGHSFTEIKPVSFDEQFQVYKKIFETSGKMAIWGAGAKGSTFLNLLDKDRTSVEYVIDINPAKQHKFIAGSGHAIYSPAVLTEKPVDTILVMNENYMEEIRKQVLLFNLEINLLSL